jgi:hypothetical protein
MHRFVISQPRYLVVTDKCRAIQLFGNGMEFCYVLRQYYVNIYVS